MNRMIPSVSFISDGKGRKRDLCLFFFSNNVGAEGKGEGKSTGQGYDVERKGMK